MMFKEITELWFELIRTQSILEKFIKKIKENKIAIELSQQDIQECEKIALEAVQKRFPNLGIKKRV